MADLKIDYAVLDEVHGALKYLRSELERSETRRDDMESCWGGTEIRRAMRGFVDDWDRHRRKLIVSLRELSDLSAGTAETFRAVEAALAAGVAVDGGHPVGTP